LKNLPEELMLGVPHFQALMDSCEHSMEVEEAILKIFDAKWKVRDEASGELHSIRQEIAQVRREITKNFQRVFKDCQGKGFLGDSGESYLYDRRVLSVFSTYKRKVSGNVLGTSKTGAITYIEPSANILLNSQLEMLFGDERAEIRKILQRLTKYLASHATLLHTIHKTLLQLDDLQARARLAIALNASHVEYSEQPTVQLHKAFHPLLYLKNLERKVTTVPQHILLDQDQRMMVISGPNAGGKSITLKTVGLLQLMWECGLMIPAAENSVMSRFDCVLTDIGDNQSIENQLSTYSYRLKRMKFFLEAANRRSLVLLDEFGTGSDPELGGALAEVFFEELYSKRTFGVITTHFSPIKVKASQLRNAINGCMLFDTKTLAPTYQLSIGEPGSSFTFEVAKMNGIPEELLGRAKKKLSSQKIKMDGLLTDLQKQKSELDHAMKEASEQTKRAKKEEEGYLHKVGKLEEKLAKQQLLSERNNKYIIIGKRIDAFIDQYNLRTKNKEVMEE
jgi:DNA mismatch repair protein MutS2